MQLLQTKHAGQERQTDGQVNSGLDNVGLIGNGRIAALIDGNARILWWCFPRFDSDPIFSRLLSGDDEKGFCDVIVSGAVKTTSDYLRNTAIIETIIEDRSGNAVRVTDFAPRYIRFERLYHPAKIIRRIEPIRGLPHITLRVRPTFNYGDARAVKVAGSNHIRYSGSDDVVRVTTDAPVSYITNETAFALTRPISLVFGADEPLEAAVETVAREALDRTHDYWMLWVRGLAIPLEWQREVIRAAITLRLCAFEETGAIVAAHTTSIPEAPFTERNWDYRYCWIRDSHFVIRALNRLGATQTMESYLDYITTLAVESKDMIRPVYGIVHDADLSEFTVPNLSGFQSMGPVRVGNAAAEQHQHDACGSIVLSVAQMFIDQRLPRMGDEALYVRLKELGVKAQKLALEPDAGIWEYRGRKRVHTHSASMCWVALDRLALIARSLGKFDEAEKWRVPADRLRAEILERSWNGKRQALTGALDYEELDACVLLLAELGLLAPDDPRFVSTIGVVGKELGKHGYITRYTSDDFGAPKTAFLACQFWYIDALAASGQVDRARELLADVLARRNAFGLFAEDFDPVTGQLWGNFPQTYVMAGIINSCMTLSRPWDQAWQRV